MKRDIVLSLFDDSGNLFSDWRAAGYTTVCVDLLPLEYRVATPGVIHLAADLKKRISLPFDTDRIAFCSAHPPCSHLAVSGARWWAGKGLRKLSESIALFATAAEMFDDLGAPFMIENPVSAISTHWRKPDHIYHPWQYSAFAAEDYYTKKTCLWVGHGFVMPPPAYDEERYRRGQEQRRAVLAKYGRKRGATAVQQEQPDYPDSRIFNTGGALKAYIRSVTPKGFGRAVFYANCEAADLG